MAFAAVLTTLGVDARQMYIGNLKFEDKFRQTGTVKNETIGAAVFISAEELENKVGAELKSVSFYHLYCYLPPIFPCLPAAASIPKPFPTIWITV